MPEEDPRKALMQAQQKYVDGREGTRQRSMEKQVLSLILSAYGVKHKGYILRDFEKKEHTLSWLWEQHPDSPVRLIARHIYKWSLADLFNRFTKSPIYDAFEDAIDAHDGEFVGAVFKADRLGMMVIHNWSATDFNGTLLLPNCSVARYGRIIVQQFKFFLERLVKDWQPSGSPLEVS